MTEAEDFEGQLLAQMRQDFLGESQEILDRLGTLMVQLEQSGDPELLHAIFRETHTLKGTAGFVGFNGIRVLAHKMEDVFGALREGRLTVTPELIDAALNGVQVLTAMRADVLRGGTGDLDSAAVLAQLEDALQGRAQKVKEAQAPVKPADTCQEHKEVSPPAPLPEPTQPKESEEALAPASQAASTLRVPVETLDAMMELVGELITARNALVTTAEQSHNEQLLGIAAVINRLTQDLQATITSVRLVPVERLFNRFTSVVRNTARECGKQARLTIKGGDTPLDRTISEQMYDPFVHLLRNAVDHGLESPEERKRKGKPAEGDICLSAERRGDNVILRVADDGAGIDPAQVRRIAVERGLHSADEAAALSDEQAIHLIFATGISTAKRVTDLSGRGVGLDVVAQNVRRLRGSINIQSVVGQGATFIIQLPLTLAILQVQLVRVGNHTYAIPLHIVRETLQIKPGDIQTMQQREIIFVHSIALPLRRLSDFGLGAANGNGQIKTDNSALQNGIVVHLTGRDEVLVVDGLVGKQQMVVKPLSPYLGTVKGVEGAAILPDGSVTLILNIEELM
jgi:two-component system chemotaxis sensor kinase CheA